LLLLLFLWLILVFCSIFFAFTVLTGMILSWMDRRAPKKLTDNES
jgi:ABC-type arginine transport system permease subunit